MIKIPLSYNQRGPWHLYHLFPENSAYNQGVALNIRSRIDSTALKQSFGTIIDRHGAFRTGFSMENGKPTQVIHDAAELDFAEIDASSWNKTETHRNIVSEIHRPFVLGNPPLMRIRLFKVSSEEFILLLVIHHIIADGWSIRTTLLPELNQIYSSILLQRRPNLLTPNETYESFVHWQETLVTSTKGNESWRYWQERLSGELPSLNLPTDFPRPAVKSFRGSAYSFQIDESLVRRIENLARSKDVTVPTVLLAAFNVLLARHSNQEDIIVGMLVSGRTQPQFNGIIGDFFNSAPIRSIVSADRKFSDFLVEVFRRITEALDHQDFPFPLLVEKLNYGRDTSRSPIFQAGFVYRKFPAPPPADQTSEFRFLSLDVPEEQEGHFDLNMIVQQLNPEEKTLTVHFKFSTDLFEASSIERMAESFQALLQGICTTPDIAISDLPILKDPERHKILVEWNDTKKNYPFEACLHELVESQIARSPNAPAVSYGNESWTYRELDERANRLAHHLSSLGVGPEVFVGICMNRSLEMILGLLGILKAGGAYVPIDPDYPEDRISFMLQDSNVSILLTHTSLARRLPNPNAVKILCLDALNEVLQNKSPVKLNLRKPAPTNAVYMIYTSGSTGKPKGAINLHRGVCNRLLWMQDAYQLTAADRILQKTPFSFDVSGWEFFWPLIAGAELVFAKPGGHKDTGYLATTIGESKITTVHFVPSMLRMFLEEPKLGLCKSLKRVICSGEALPVDLVDRYFQRLDAELHNLYGPTEASIDVTYWKCKKETREPHTIPIGRPIANTQAYILDRKMNPTPIGVVGEIYLGGVGIGRGYWNRPELTKERFVPDPFRAEVGASLYQTGDLGRFRSDGNIEYLGRSDFQVKIRGFRIELGEIETALSKHMAIKDNAVTAIQEPNQDRYLVAYVAPREGVEISASELRDHLRPFLPEYMIPSRFVFLPNLPLSPNGKIDRKALPRPTAERPTLDHDAAEPRNKTERDIVTVWREVLQISKVGINDNFFDLGGHSLLLAEVHARLQSSFHREFSFLEMFRYPTIQLLAEFISREPQSDSIEVPVEGARGKQRHYKRRHKAIQE